MTRVYDRDRPPAGLPPVDIAQMRANRLDDPLDQLRFMEAFRVGRITEARGQCMDRAWRHHLDEDDSVWVAGYIEGVSSVDRNQRKVF